MLEVYVKEKNGIWFGVASESYRVFALSFAENEQDALRKVIESIPFQAEFKVVSSGSSFSEKIITAVRAVYEGKQAVSQIVFSMEHLPLYTQKVLWAVYKIPVGYLASYGGVAKAVGGGARSVGNVMASNPFAPLIPCHRIVSSNFGLGGYGGGLDAKLRLLNLEKRGFNSVREISVGEKTLSIFPVEFVLRKNNAKSR
jgi:O-6-methylguanine DNA methyltransferase